MLIDNCSFMNWQSLEHREFGTYTEKVITFYLKVRILIICVFAKNAE